MPLMTAFVTLPTDSTRLFLNKIAAFAITLAKHVLSEAVSTNAIRARLQLLRSERTTLHPRKPAPVMPEKLISAIKSALTATTHVQSVQAEPPRATALSARPESTVILLAAHVPAMTDSTMMALLRLASHATPPVQLAMVHQLLSV